MPLATDTIRINRLLHLGQVAQVLDIPIETLRTLNPQYKMDIIPATIKHYTLVLPQRYVCQYIDHEEEIHKLDSTYLKEYIDPVNIEKKIIADQTPALYGQKGRYAGSHCATLSGDHGSDHEVEQAEECQQTANRTKTPHPNPPIKNPNV